MCSSGLILFWNLSELIHSFQSVLQLVIEYDISEICNCHIFENLVYDTQNFDIIGLFSFSVSLLHKIKYLLIRYKYFLSCPCE